MVRWATYHDDDFGGGHLAGQRTRVLAHRSTAANCAHSTGKQFSANGILAIRLLIRIRPKRVAEVAEAAEGAEEAEEATSSRHQRQQPDSLRLILILMREYRPAVLRGTKRRPKRHHARQLRCSFRFNSCVCVC